MIAWNPRFALAVLRSWGSWQMMRSEQSDIGSAISVQPLHAFHHGWAHVCSKLASMDGLRIDAFNNGIPRAIFAIVTRTLSTTCRCAVTRKVWRSVLPALAFDQHELLGFVSRTLDSRTRVFICCILFLVYEARRAWQYHGRHNHNMDIAHRAVLLHAASLQPRKGAHIRQFIQTCEFARSH